MFSALDAWKQRLQPHSRMLDGTVFLSLATLVLYTVSKHEPWADEAQAWLLARDFSFLKLLVSELRYEGHPALWFAILSVAIHVFHLPYAYFGYLAGSLALLGLGVLIFLAPFPRPLRYLIAFSFFFAYQYAVLARPYVLMPLFGFLAAHFYRQGLRRVLAFAIATALLIQVSLYAAVVAFALTVSYIVRLLPRWKEISQKDHQRTIRAGALLVLSGILFIAVLYPPPDSSTLAESMEASFPRHMRHFQEGLQGGLAVSAFPTILLLGLATIWAHVRRGLLLLILSVGGTAFVYGFLRWIAHLQGLITIAFVVFLWAAWPCAKQLETLSPNSRWLHQATLAAVLLTFAWHCTWSYSAIRKEWAGPYSGAPDAAKFLKSVAADKLGCNGYLFWAVGVQPYFDHNIFLNYGGPDAPASFRWSFDFKKHADVLMASQARNGPPFIVVSKVYENPQEAIPMIESYRSVNYVLVHYSDGTQFFKESQGVHDPYFIFEKLDFALAAQKH